MLLPLLLVACHPSGEAGAPGLGLVLSLTDPHAAIATVDTSDLSAESPVDLRCVAVLEDGTEEIHILSSVAEVTVIRGLLAGTRYACTATVDRSSSEEPSSEEVSVTTPPLPATFPVVELSVPGDPALVGYHLVNLARLIDPALDEEVFFSGEYVAILDAEGRPRWRYPGEGGGDIDVTWLGDGRILFGGFGAEVSTAPTIVDLDGATRLLVPESQDATWEVPASWHHDVGISEDGGSIWALDEESIPLDTDGAVWEGFVVKQLDITTGATLDAWSSMDDGVARGGLLPGTRTDRFPFHANAVWDRMESDGAKLYVSLRDANQVIRIDLATRQVDLKIGLGGNLTLLHADGSPASDGDWFFGQHDVKRVGDRLVVYDNGVHRADYGSLEVSRALVLLLDEAAGTATIETSWGSNPDWDEPAWGGLDRREDGRLDLAVGNFWWILPERAPIRSALALLAPDDEGAGAGGATEEWRLLFPDREIALYRSDTILGCDLFAVQAYCPALADR